MRDNNYHAADGALTESRGRRRSRSRSRERYHDRDIARRYNDDRQYNNYNHNHSRRDFDRERREAEPQRRHSSTSQTVVTHPPSDPNLSHVDDDPRCTREGKVVKISGGGRNTTSFDPASTLVRPAMRVILEANTETIDRELSHDDVVIVPNFLCEKDDWSLYYKLIEEMRQSQASGAKGAEWISWHEGAHLISKNPEGSATYQMIQEKIAKFFSIPMTSVGTRFNWYRDSSDWKPFHHDSAAFNPTRARNQNITVGVSLGATRELSFLSASNDTMLTFPQTNGMLFSFGRDVNIRWKHGIRAVDPSKQQEDGRGRVSIILWGKCPGIKEEDDSPPMLPYEGPDRHLGRGKELCRDFARSSCRHGDRCKFSHSQ